jgi:hydrogenase 3 maturation protease
LNQRERSETEISGKESSEAKVMVVGIGNRLRGDDGVGCEIVTLLQEERIEAIEAGAVPENFIGVIVRRKPEMVLLVDACDFGAPGGEFRLFSSEEIERLNFKGFSSHTLPLNMFAQLISDTCGAQVWLLGIQPESITLGAGLSTTVAAALPRVVDFIRQWLKGL